MFKCTLCGKPSELKRIAKVYEQDGYVLVVKQVPCYVCTDCGEPHFSFEVLDRLDEIVTAWKSAVRGDAIVSYDTAA